MGAVTKRAVAEARRLRESPYHAAHERSLANAWDARRRAPRDLRQAVRFVRAAWISETPDALTEGPGSVGVDGNPKITAEADRFIFESPGQLDRDGSHLAFRVTPFRATLAAFRAGDEKQQAQAKIVSAVTAGERTPGEAAASAGVPWWCAGDVAEWALRSFLASMSDVVVVGG